MKYIETHSTDPYYNLALEEYLLTETDLDVFMLWQNEPTVVIGKNQNAYAEVDRAFLESKQIHLARRITGGGAVYHDLGNVNYSFITSSEKAQILDFAYFSSPVVSALKSLGINAELSGRNDLVIKCSDADGSPAVLKFSGNAQTEKQGRILHHGTLLFDSDMSVLSSALKPDPEKLRKKDIKSVRSRVTNLKPLIDPSFAISSASDFIAYLRGYCCRLLGCEVTEADARTPLLKELAERNASDRYNWGEDPSVSQSSSRLSVKKSYEGGLVTLSCAFDIEKNELSDFRIEGDFFERKSTAELCGYLNSLRAAREELCLFLSDELLEEYSPGFKAEWFRELTR